MIKSDTK